MPFISYGKQFLDKSDISNVSKVLKSDFLTQGFEVKKILKQILKKIESEILYSCFGGTAVLHLLGLV